jgi:exopolysaccharide production protein ExoZ
VPPATPGNPANLAHYQAAGRLQTLQALRFLAATLVLFAHSVDSVHAAGGRTAIDGTSLENFGAAGVDIFFVISGFIITLTARRALSPGQFLLDRLLRLAPFYWLISIPAAFYTISALGFRPATLLTTLLFWPVWGQFTDPYLLVGWTLAFEMLFYLAMGTILAGLPWRLILAAYVVLFVLQFQLADPTVRFLGNPIILEFLLGVGIAALGPRGHGRAVLVLALAWFAATLVLGYGAISEADRIESGELALPRVLLWGVPSALLVYAAVNHAGPAAGRGWNLLGRLGDASYTLYLSHRYVLKLCAVLAAQWSLVFDYSLPVAALAIVLALPIHDYVEKPLRSSLRGLAGRRGLRRERGTARACEAQHG